MSRHKRPNPRRPKSNVPDIAASGASGLVKRGVDLGLIRDAVVDNIDRPGVFPLGPLLTARDVMSLLQVSRTTVYSWINRDQIPYLRINGVVRFSANRLASWLMERERGPLPDITDLLEADPRGTTEVPTLESVGATVGGARTPRGKPSQRGQAAKARKGKGYGATQDQAAYRFRCPSLIAFRSP